MDASALASEEYWLSWIATAKLAAAFLVAIGVAMEFGSEWASRPFDATVKHAREVQVVALETAAETARGEIAEATKAAATANERAAGANERAANLEKEAAAANERAAAIMRATAWRQFRPNQTDALRQALSTKPGKIKLSWVANDSEAFALAYQFSQLLDAAHWTFSTSAETFSGALVWGITVPDGSPEAAENTKALRDALTAAGIHFSTEQLPPRSMSFTEPGGADFATVLFGSKSPTFSQPPE